MSKPPILDERWMRQRAQMRYMQSLADNLGRIERYGSAADTPESLRDDYATGKIDYDELQRRLDAVLLRPVPPRSRPRRTVTYWFQSWLWTAVFLTLWLLGLAVLGYYLVWA